MELDRLTGVFTPEAGSSPTTYTQPSEFQADLVAVAGGGWTLTMHQTQDKLTFNASGLLTQVADRNSNPTSFNVDAYNHPISIISSRGSGTSSTTTGTVATSGGRITGVSEAGGGLSRSVTIGYDSSSRVHTVYDDAGGTTTFGYGTGSPSSPTNQVVSISNPSSETT